MNLLNMVLVSIVLIGLWIAFGKLAILTFGAKRKEDVFALVILFFLCAVTTAGIINYVFLGKGV